MDLKQTINLPPGKYVLAVSGGVDSVVLLDLLAHKPGIELIVAHLDHGIRPDSAEDAKFVAELAARYGLPYETSAVQLGADASEAEAREVRYEFLSRIMQDNTAQAIITAHHQDDLLETAIMNLLRGSGRLGLTSLASRDGLIRPLLGVPKRQLLDYAKQHDLKWREDSTNSDTKYLRNRVRHNLLAKADDNWREQFRDHLRKAEHVNNLLEKELDQLLQYRMSRSRGTLARAWLIGLPHNISCELVHAWLRRQGIKDIDRKLVERIVVAVKTARIGAKIDIDRQNYLLMTKRSARLVKHKNT